VGYQNHLKDVFIKIETQAPKARVATTIVFVITDTNPRIVIADTYVRFGT